MGKETCASVELNRRGKMGFTFKIFVIIQQKDEVKDLRILTFYLDPLHYTWGAVPRKGQSKW